MCAGFGGVTQFSCDLIMVAVKGEERLSAALVPGGGQLWSFRGLRDRWSRGPDGPFYKTVLDARVAARKNVSGPSINCQDVIKAIKHRLGHPAVQRIDLHQGQLQASFAMAFSGCLHDEDFGPAVHGCRENFDFTIKFERIFLSLISASMFLAIAQIRIIFLTQRPRMVNGNWFWILKVV